VCCLQPPFSGVDYDVDEMRSLLSSCLKASGKDESHTSSDEEEYGFLIFFPYHEDLDQARAERSVVRYFLDAVTSWCW
jgi:hypothetical protein